MVKATQKATIPPEQLKKIRRRIEDTLRKIDDADMLIWIASILKVRTD